MKTVAAYINGLSAEQLTAFESTGELAIPGTEYMVQLTDVEIIAEDIPGWQVTNLGNLTVALDITLTEELKQEGLSRELINRIQNLRKELNFEVTDRIKVTLQNHNLIATAALQNKLYICSEILADDLTLTESPVIGNKITIDDVELQISIEKQ